MPLAYVLVHKSISSDVLSRTFSGRKVLLIHTDRSDPSNYCPIGLTCVACKIMESIIKDVVITYLLENNLLSNCQFGFVSGRSVQLQLLPLLNHWTGILVSGHTIDVIYLDFKKAFDSVPTYAFYPNYIPMGFVIHF